MLLVARNSTDTAYFQRLRPYPRVLLRRSHTRFKDYVRLQHASVLHAIQHPALGCSLAVVLPCNSPCMASCAGQDAHRLWSGPVLHRQGVLQVRTPSHRRACHMLHCLPRLHMYACGRQSNASSAGHPALRIAMHACPALMIHQSHILTSSGACMPIHAFPPSIEFHVCLPARRWCNLCQASSQTAVCNQTCKYDMKGNICQS